MPSSFLALPASLAVLSLLAAQAPSGVSNPAIEAALSHASQMDAIDSAEAVSAPAPSRHPEIGLRAVHLQTASLQPASSLDSAAGGLLSEEAWRVIFPKRTEP